MWKVRGKDNKKARRVNRARFGEGFSPTASRGFIAIVREVAPRTLLGSSLATRQRAYECCTVLLVQQARVDLVTAA